MRLPHAPNLPEQVVQFAPKEKRPRNAADELDQAGEATIALLQQATNLSNERCDRAMDLGHQLSLKLRAAEDRIRQLQGERDQIQDRSARAEEWLRRIYHEVEERLISPRAGSPRASL
jgi:hypothetical protein